MYPEVILPHNKRAYKGIDIATLDSVVNNRTHSVLIALLKRVGVSQNCLKNTHGYLL